MKRERILIWAFLFIVAILVSFVSFFIPLAWVRGVISMAIGFSVVQIGFWANIQLAKRQLENKTLPTTDELVELLVKRLGNA